MKILKKRKKGFEKYEKVSSKKKIKKKQKDMKIYFIVILPKKQ